MAGRKKLESVANRGPDFDADVLTERRQELVVAHEAGELVTGDQAAVWAQATMYAGRIQAAMVSATVAERIIAESYVKVVESKGYVGMPYAAPDGTARHVASLDEFCQLFLGKSKRRCQELASNLEALGAELYESAERIGLGQRDYNALRALPDDDQAVVKQALAEGGDRVAVVGLLTSLIERKATELAAAREDIATKDDRNQKLSDKLDRADEQVIKAQRRWKAASPDERQSLLEQRILAAKLDLLANIGSETSGLAAVFMELADHCNANGLDCSQFMGDVLGEMLTAVRVVRDGYEDGFPVPVVRDGEA